MGPSRRPASSAALKRPAACPALRAKPAGNRREFQGGDSSQDLGSDDEAVASADKRASKRAKTAPVVLDPGKDSGGNDLPRTGHSPCAPRQIYAAKMFVADAPAVQEAFNEGNG
ncbi:unnamed protein product [Prorocentrum cordatum]|uniref:Uncharacterized protein n=1 Tax=Prorocentrum cordatum TaxID=2364126 RepID=A0ABN9WNY2_9DINO|nr:unnamed protein product [Polarella glacialis]